jgi:uncharacterized protein YgfB (UPF0149 family)
MNADAFVLVPAEMHEHICATLLNCATTMIVLQAAAENLVKPDKLIAPMELLREILQKTFHDLDGCLKNSTTQMCLEDKPHVRQ